MIFFDIFDDQKSTAIKKKTGFIFASIFMIFVILLINITNDDFRFIVFVSQLGVISYTVTILYHMIKGLTDSILSNGVLQALISYEFLVYSAILINVLYILIINCKFHEVDIKDIALRHSLIMILYSTYGMIFEEESDDVIPQKIMEIIVVFFFFFYFYFFEINILGYAIGLIAIFSGISTFVNKVQVGRVKWKKITKPKFFIALCYFLIIFFSLKYEKICRIRSLGKIFINESKTLQKNK